MKKNLKIGTIAILALLAFSAVAYVYAWSNRFATSYSEQQSDAETPMYYLEPNNITMPCPRGHMREDFGPGGSLQFAEDLLQNATLSTVQGTVVSEVRGTLILNTGSGQIRIMLPKEWTVGTEVVNRISLFNGTFASPGDTVTLKVLEATLVANSNFSINTMLGYEAVNSSDAHAYAVLPFNIQPAS